MAETIEIEARLGQSAAGEIDTGILDAFLVRDNLRRRVAYAMRDVSDSPIHYIVPVAEALRKQISQQFAAARKTQRGAVVVEEPAPQLEDGPKQNG